MKTNTRIEIPSQQITPNQLANSTKGNMKTNYAFENEKSDFKLHLALKLSRFFELKIEDDFDTEQYKNE